MVDLVSGKAYSFAGNKAVPVEIPEDIAAAVSGYREQLVETAVESDDDLMAKYLEGEEITESELRQAIKKGVAANSLVPVLAGSSAKNIGIQTLLDAITNYLPSAAERMPASENVTAAFVFNTVVDPQKGQQTFFRTYSGTIKSDSHVFNVTTSTDERLGQLFSVRGKSQEGVAAVPAGDIGAVVKLSNTHTGDTLGVKET